MKFLFYDMGSFIYRDFKSELEKLGHICKTLYYHFPDKYEDEFFCDRFRDYLLADSYDAVISVNFFPLVAIVCNQMKVRYISWCYDSPLEERLIDFFPLETNYIFLFDRIEVEEYRAKGYHTVFHLPLAVNTKRIDSLLGNSVGGFYTDISFVGKIYESSLAVLVDGIAPFFAGYIDAILQAQFRVYGYNFIDKMISEEMLASINKKFEVLGQLTEKLNSRGLFFAIASKITQVERTILLEEMSDLGSVYFYTTGEPNLCERVKICGPVGYFDEMPRVFRHSKINLNPTLKSIKSGIPLRALDILGSRGVLFSNYQLELAENFKDGKEVIMYNSIDDAIDKAGYYLKKEELRRQIAFAGYNKVKEEYSFASRIKEMFIIAKL